MGLFKKSWIMVSVALVAVLTCTHCNRPKGFIYGNNDTYAPQSPYIYKIDLATGNVIDYYPNLSGGSHGRGVAVIANIMYYTSGASNCVFTYNLTTKTDNGCLFHVAGANALSSLAFDGTNLWIQEFVGSNPSVAQYDITGSPTLVATFAPSKCSGANPFCDGLEYFYTSPSTIPACPPGVLISNRGDATDPYDAYAAAPPTAISCKAAFITPTTQDSGIAWDGMFLYASDVLGKVLQVFDSSGTSFFFEPTIAITNAIAPPPYDKIIIEDLSTDYARQFCFPPRRTVYSNGPVNGQSDKKFIAYGQVVSNSFVISKVPPWATQTLSDFCVALWVAAGDTPVSFEWSISSAPNGGTVFAEGTAGGGNLKLDFLSHVKNNLPGCQFDPPNDGCDVYQAEISFNGTAILPPGTYYLNLANAIDAQGSGTSWDVNYGANCSSLGCPSTAWVNGTTSISSESFIVR